MTPVLVGRWQTRTFMMLTFGIPISIIFAIIWQDMITPFMALSYILIIGLVLDIAWNWVQGRRWENDFPPVLHAATGAIEGLLFWVLAKTITLPLIPVELSLHRFLAHYCSIFIVIFFVLWSLMKVLFPWWRFHGGRIFTQAPYEQSS